MLPVELQESLRLDLLKVFRMLIKNNKEYRLDDPTELASDINEYYHSHKSSIVKEEDTIIKQQLLGVISRLKRTNKLYFDDRDSTWVRVYSFDPKDETVIDKCTVRFYLNLKFEKLVTLVELIMFYLQIPAKESAPLMFKFPHPNNLQERYVSGTDKVVLYVSPENDLPSRLQAKIQSFSDDCFYDAVPLFTHKIKKGVGMAYEPKEESVIVNYLRRIKKTDEIYLSYGTYMAYVIARSIQLAIFRNTTLTKKDKLNLSRLTEQQREKIYLDALQFIMTRASEDLHI